MKRYKTLFAVLLTIFTLAFIVFVGFMQQKFNNPEFTDLSTVQTGNSDNDQKQSEGEEDVENDGVAGAAGSVVNDNESDENESDENESEAEEEPVEVTTSTRTVLVDSLNARSGPSIDHEITGVLVINQVVEVEDSGEEWVKVITDDFTGYVNEKYLSEE